MHNALRRARPITDPVPEDLVDRLGLIDRDTALAHIHFPPEPEDSTSARRRLVFDEFFRLEVALALQKRRQMAEARGIAHRFDGELVARFIEGLPYVLTGAQKNVLDEIKTDLGADHPMHRLLQGEVGSGKTVVAVATLLVAVQGGNQGAVMAPTEVLAEQHFMSIRGLLEVAGLSPPQEGVGGRLGMVNLFATGGPVVKIALLTSSQARTNYDPGAARSDVIDAIRKGDVDLVVGTHSLIQEGIEFARLAIAVIDEQHRFGVGQRVLLKEKATEADPDLLIRSKRITGRTPPS